MSRKTSSSERLLREAQSAVGQIPATPSSRLAVVTCMDARIDPFTILKLRPGEAHIMRNAGGLVTGDVVRSLIVSQRTLGTNRIDLMMHTQCGMLKLDEAALRRAITADAGPGFERSFGAFDDLEAELVRGVEVLRSTPSLVDRAHVRGLIYDVDSGRATVRVGS